MGRPSLAGMAAFVHRVHMQTEIAPDIPGSETLSPRSAAEVQSEPRPAASVSAPPLQGPSYSQPDGHPEGWGGSQADWDTALRALQGSTTQEATVVGWNRGGLLVQWQSLQGFLPASQLLHMIHYTTEAERDAAFARRVGEALHLRVIEVDRARRRLVFSERALQWGPENGEHLWRSLSPGQVLPGRVRNLCNFGAFIDLGGIDGLIHISELSWRHVRHPSDVLQVSQEVNVLVMAVEPERKRVALSLKKLCQDPWEDIGERYCPGQIVAGIVTNVVSFGAFVGIEEGVEGLIHISELAEGDLPYPRSIIGEGQNVTVRVIGIDSSNRRLALSLRQMHDLDEAGQSNAWAPRAAQ